MRLSILSTLLFAACSLAFSQSANNNVALYWGQNSAGKTGSQGRLADYCDGSSDIILLSFLHIFFGTSGLPEVNFAASCNDGSLFPGTGLLQCPNIAEDIKICQGKGKIILLSLGGASGAYGFSSDSQAEQFAQTVWDMFAGGSSSTRPFGDSVIDGFDLDIEGGSTTGYAAFSNKLRQLYSTDSSKQYYISAAPQCPCPDVYVNSAIVGSKIDFLFVQFYNNYCGMQTWQPNNADPNFNYLDWDKLVKSSPNPDCKVYLGVPASPSAAGSGYVPISKVVQAANYLQNTYSTFGGIMMWDASQAVANVDSSTNLNFAAGAKQGLGGANSPQVPSVTVPSVPPSSSASSSTLSIVVTPSSSVVPTIPSSSSSLSSSSDITTTVLTTITTDITSILPGTSTSIITISKSDSSSSSSSVSTPSSSSPSLPTPSSSPTTLAPSSPSLSVSVPSSSSSSVPAPSSSSQIVTITLTSTNAPPSATPSNSPITSSCTESSLFGNLPLSVAPPAITTSPALSVIGFSVYSSVDTGGDVIYEYSTMVNPQSGSLVQRNIKDDEEMDTLAIEPSVLDFTGPVPAISSAVFVPISVASEKIDTAYSSAGFHHRHSHTEFAKDVPLIVHAINTPANDVESDSDAEFCPVEGGTCNTPGELKCTLDGYAQCISGTWVIRPCSIGTVCKESGLIVFCDWAGSSTPSDSKCGGHVHTKRDSSDSASSKTFSHGDFAALTPSNETLTETMYTLKISVQQLNSTNFNGIITASTVTNNPIGPNWQLSFASVLNITGVGRGALVGYDEETSSYTVASIPLAEPASNMAILIPFWGTYP